MRGSGELWKSCSRYWRRMLRISSEVFAFECLSAEFFCSEAQERDDSWATELGVAGGKKAGGTPRSSAWRRFLARTSSLDCGVRVTRPPIWKLPPQKAQPEAW